ncbi:DUF536 domain-containing protein [Secundilactobacillus kimchicus]|uniref:DUF536 domain-containing protein n=1 Tax=Secundilactobacillus kimchicus TaxID=528209 RepID=UPI001C030FC4|nr:DUF536 domain-containing protein [Secundilactobacillus kimchicus]MBT9670447.1 DUF536 domain-containing protein [Secundilactobacillus kimchicus]
MSKTIKELAEEFSVSKQAIRKKLDPKFRANYVQTVTRNGVQTLVVTDPGYSLLKQHFEGGNDQQLSGGNVAGNTGNDNMDTIDILKQQLTVKDQQLKAKDEQLKLMQQLLDQSQQLQLMAEQKLVHHEALGTTESPDKSPDEPTTSAKPKHKWWPFS